MNNYLLVKENVVARQLFYNNEPIMSFTIKYPSFESREFSQFTDYLNYYYFVKLVINSVDQLYELYNMAIQDYEYALANEFPVRPFEFYLDYSITYNENCTISLYYNTYTYTGGAHGNTIRKSDTWNIKEHKLMNVYDYFAEPIN